MHFTADALGPLSEKEPERLLESRDTKAALHHRPVVVAARFQPLAHRHVSDMVIKTQLVR